MNVDPNLPQLLARSDSGQLVPGHARGSLGDDAYVTSVLQQEDVQLGLVAIGSKGPKFRVNRTAGCMFLERRHGGSLFHSMPNGG